MVRVSHIRYGVLVLTFTCLSNGIALKAQSPHSAQARMRPIGSPSAVDQFRAPTNQQRLRETVYQSPVRQVAMLQNGITSPPLPTQPNGPITLPANPGAQPVPNANVPANRALPTQPIASSSDIAPMPQPQLRNSFATVDNCNLVSPPSGYSSAYGNGCGQVGYVAPGTQTFQVPPAEVAAPAIMPGVRRAQAGAPMGSLITFGQERFPVQVGQGLWGQPVAYVPGQPLRNWIRYFFP